ncbi:MAG: DNA ligase-associated DEXH box helicase, partial [Akkermansiaceae bacterium]|nr:DNA ligase-associated DEXH box helicase [Akkermansiaceae bacterium]
MIILSHQAVTPGTNTVETSHQLFLRDTACLAIVATGGYALKTYERFKRIVKTNEGRYRVRHPDVAQRYRMNVGTIVEAPMITVRLVGRKRPEPARASKPAPMHGGRVLGEVE